MQMSCWSFGLALPAFCHRRAASGLLGRRRWDAGAQRASLMCDILSTVFVYASVSFPNGPELPSCGKVVIK